MPNWVTNGRASQTFPLELFKDELQLKKDLIQTENKNVLDFDDHRVIKTTKLQCVNLKAEARSTTKSEKKDIRPS